MCATHPPHVFRPLSFFLQRRCAEVPVSWKRGGGSEGFLGVYIEVRELPLWESPLAGMLVLCSEWCPPRDLVHGQQELVTEFFCEACSMTLILKEGVYGLSCDERHHVTARPQPALADICVADGCFSGSSPERSTVDGERGELLALLRARTPQNGDVWLRSFRQLGQEAGSGVNGVMDDGLCGICVVVWVEEEKNPSGEEDIPSLSFIIVGCVEKQLLLNWAAFTKVSEETLSPAYFGRVESVLGEGSQASLHESVGWGEYPQPDGSSGASLRFMVAILTEGVLRKLRIEGINRRNSRSGSNRRSQRKPRRLAVSCSTIPTCEHLGSTPPGIGPGSPRWEASSLTTRLRLEQNRRELGDFGFVGGAIRPLGAMTDRRKGQLAVCRPWSVPAVAAKRGGGDGQKDTHIYVKVLDAGTLRKLPRYMRETCRRKTVLLLGRRSGAQKRERVLCSSARFLHREKAPSSPHAYQGDKLQLVRGTIPRGAFDAHEVSALLDCRHKTALCNYVSFTSHKERRGRGEAVGATVAERLAYSPPTKAIPGSVPCRVTPDFRMWESCRMMPLFGGFSRGYPVSPALSFRCCSILISVTCVGSKDLDMVNAMFDSLPLSRMNCRIAANESKQSWLVSKFIGQMTAAKVLHAVQHVADQQMAARRRLRGCWRCAKTLNTGASSCEGTARGPTCSSQQMAARRRLRGCWRCAKTLNTGASSCEGTARGQHVAHQEMAVCRRLRGCWRCAKTSNTPGASSCEGTARGPTCSSPADGRSSQATLVLEVCEDVVTHHGASSCELPADGLSSQATWVLEVCEDVEHTWLLRAAKVLHAVQHVDPADGRSSQAAWVLEVCEDVEHTGASSCEGTACGPTVADQQMALVAGSWVLEVCEDVNTLVLRAAKVLHAVQHVAHQQMGRSSQATWVLEVCEDVEHRCFELRRRWPFVAGYVGVGGVRRRLTHLVLRAAKVLHAVQHVAHQQMAVRRRLRWCWRCAKTSNTPGASSCEGTARGPTCSSPADGRSSQATWVLEVCEDVEHTYCFELRSRWPLVAGYVGVGGVRRRRTHLVLRAAKVLHAVQHVADQQMDARRRLRGCWRCAKTLNTPGASSCEGTARGPTRS
ncbi:hypothetical protein PR048_018969 [Dryococelus australis]|uniref:Uncharacterized protein n=1 Tax=Dryococelus australis TaxID=614101 RepID=A0ABQ9H2I1_9NEOP|nr:hypothetical protein PR048_018969 [Dryococelus australis]